MSKIFISYRREDSQWPADRLYQTLKTVVRDPKADLFIDIDNIPFGVDFARHLDEKVAQCEIVLALIGRDWLDMRNPQTGARRLDDPKDFVRIEIASALKRDIRVVPVLLEGASIPSADDLPDDLKPLAMRNGVEVRRVSFDADVGRLVAGLGIGKSRPRPQPALKPAARAHAPQRVASPTPWPAIAIAAVLALTGVGGYVFVANPFGWTASSPRSATAEITPDTTGSANAPAPASPGAAPAEPSQQADASPAAAPASPPQDTSAAQAAWAKVDSTRPDALRAFLKSRGTSPEAAEAKSRLAALDDKAWGEANKSNNVAGFKTYLAAFPATASPAGKSSAEATARLEALERASQPRRPPTPPAAAQLSLAASVQPFRIAIPDFQASGPGSAEVSAQIAQVVRDDLGSSAVFRMLDKASFVERDVKIDVLPRFPDWTVVQAQGLVVGNAVVSAQNGLNVQFRVYDPVQKTQIYATQYSVPSVLNWRRVAHMVADDIYEQLTGVPGAYDTRIAFVSRSDGRSRLAIMDADSANAEFLLSGFDKVLQPLFNPAGNMIAFANGDGASRRVFIYDIVTGRQEAVSPDGVTAHSPVYAPDGRALLFVDESDTMPAIAEIDLARKTISYPLTRQSDRQTSPSVSPDGAMIAYIAYGKILKIARRDGADMSCPSVARAPSCEIASADQISSARWSPAGTHIVFAKQDGGVKSIAIVQPDGTNARVLTQGNGATEPSWSPNGREIVFTRAEAAGEQLWKIDISGRNLRRAVTPRNGAQPSWSANLK